MCTDKATEIKPIPDGTEFRVGNVFYKIEDGVVLTYCAGRGWHPTFFTFHQLTKQAGFEYIGLSPNKPNTPKAHPHARAMAEYAEDALLTAEPWKFWVFRLGEGPWLPLPPHPSWNNKCEYRRRPDYCVHGVKDGDIWKLDDELLLIQYVTSNGKGVDTYDLTNHEEGAAFLDEWDSFRDNAVLVFRAGGVNKL